MPKQDIAQATSQKEEPKNIKFRDFFDITKWALGIIYRISPTHMVVNVVTSLVQDVQGIVNAYIISRLLDEMIQLLQGQTSSLSGAYPYIGILIAYSFFGTINNYFRLYTERSLETFFYPKMDEFMYMKLRSLGIQTLENPGISNKITRADNEAHGVINYYFRVTTALGLIASLLVSSILVFKVAPEIIPLIVVLSVPLVLIDRHYIKKTWRFGFENTENRRKAYQSSGDLIRPASLKEIFINGAHTFLSSKFKDFADWFYGTEVQMRKKWFFVSHISSFVTDVGVYMGYLIVFAKLLVGRISVGDALFNVRLIDRISSELSNLAARISTLYEYAVRIEVIYDVFSLEPSYPDGDLIMPKLDKGPEIRIEDLDFTYTKAKNKTLRSFNLDIASGEKVAIVGHNGAGKTTLVKLLCRLYPASKGQILINGENINNLNSPSYYKNVGVLFQDYNTYGQLTVRENVVIGDPESPYDEERVLDALKKADALDFVNEYENKLDQVLSERYTGGIRPSTGQWQKLAIARFFYRNAPFVIFDEPTAAIDAVSEYNIFNKIYEFFEGKTVIIISHRFSTVRNADRIIVMENGKIIEQGTHEELMAQDGYYAKSFKLQAEGYSSASTEPVETIV